MPAKRRRATPTKAKSLSPVEIRVRSLVAFRNSDHFEEVMNLLRENSWWKQSPFIAGEWDALRAAAIDCRQGLVRILEDEIAKAEQYQPT